MLTDYKKTLALSWCVYITWSLTTDIIIFIYSCMTRYMGNSGCAWLLLPQPSQQADGCHRSLTNRHTIYLPTLVKQEPQNMPRPQLKPHRREREVKSETGWFPEGSADALSLFVFHFSYSGILLYIRNLNFGTQPSCGVPSDCFRYNLGKQLNTSKCTPAICSNGHGQTVGKQRTANN